MRYYGISHLPRERTAITHTHAYCQAFNEEELIKLERQMDKLEVEPAVVGKIGNVDETVRRCGVKFFSPDNEHAWIFGRVDQLVQRLNDEYYGFELNGYENLQFTRYDASGNDMYDWHMDMFLGSSPPEGMIEPRKLSMTLLINRPGEDFEGGDFMICDGDQRRATKLDVPYGRAVVFPSWLLHCVTPVTKGTRKSIVAWVTGPKWR